MNWNDYLPKETYWILAPPEERGFLEGLGVQVGGYDNAHGAFDGCIISEEAIQKLNPYWGRFYWGPEETEMVIVE